MSDNLPDTSSLPARRRGRRGAPTLSVGIGSREQSQPTRSTSGTGTIEPTQHQHPLGGRPPGDGVVRARSESGHASKVKDTHSRSTTTPTRLPRVLFYAEGIHSVRDPQLRCRETDPVFAHFRPTPSCAIIAFSNPLLQSRRPTLAC